MCSGRAVYVISLGASLSTCDDVVFDQIALLQGLVTLLFDRAVVNEHVRSTVAAEKAVTLGIVKPPDYTMKL